LVDKEKISIFVAYKILRVNLNYLNLTYLSLIIMVQDSMKTRVVGVDVGYEATTYAVVDVRGKILSKDSFQSATIKSINDYITILCDRITEMIDKNGGYEQIRSIGISTPCGNYLSGNIESSGKLAWKGQIPLAAMMRDRLGLAVVVANDAHARALGEFTYGCAHGMKDFLFITLGHGFGSCLFSNGRPHLGSEGFAGEVGHTFLLPAGRECDCGGWGCLESYCATDGIVKTAHELMESSDKPSMMRKCSNLTPKKITEFCDKGDEMAIEVYRRTGFILGLGLANYASVTDPEAIIITGGIANAGHWLIDPMNDSFEEHIFHNIKNQVKIVRSALKDDERNVLGASAVAWKVKEYSLFK